MSKETGLQLGISISIGSGKTTNNCDGIKTVDLRPSL